MSFLSSNQVKPFDHCKYHPPTKVPEKNGSSSHSYFFGRILNLQSKLQNSHFENLTPHRDPSTFDHSGPSQKFPKLNKQTCHSYLQTKSNHLTTANITHQQKSRKKMGLFNTAWKIILKGFKTPFIECLKRSEYKVGPCVKNCKSLKNPGLHNAPQVSFRIL